MEEYREELQRAVTSVNHAEEQWLPFIGGEGQCCKHTAAIMDRDYSRNEPIASRHPSIVAVA
ncbi:hypothetical protein NLY34_31115 [Mesorhizobium sp. C374B]|uniref:hypothetical protein n=1 Tax=unclassified Mesorhizobium TaxID=325217 RepID=UPI0018DD52AA|nr:MULTISPECIES: hypothetical protein [unclassified Mesorhizobium]WJI81093.1 hypothetical protein NLY34_31115 [Mesorhizobium sp. C374B]WJI87634.1 hypothetical protein NLY42_01850 [Mesorhizobium sp. C372A]